MLRKRVPDAGDKKLVRAAEELIESGAEVLVATGSPQVARAAKEATSVIPIVFANGGDPVKLGLVNSLNSPGGNATGVTFATSVVGSKRLQLLRQLLPNARTVMLLVNPNNPVTNDDIVTLESTARLLHFELMVMDASTDAEIENAFAETKAKTLDAVFINVDAFFASRAARLAHLAPTTG